MRALLMILAILLPGLALPVAAAELPGPPVTETGRGYADLAARRGVVADVRYPAGFDPSQLIGPDGLVPPRLLARPEPPDLDRERWIWVGAITVVLIVILALFVRYGGMRMIGFRRLRDGVREDDAGPADAIADAGGLAGFLDRLRAMRDRPAALVLLVQGALERTGHLTGTRVVQSQTAREVLRRVPADWPLRDPLGRIVRVEEVVQFGGRDLSAPVFEECLALAEPLFDARRR